MSSKHRIKHYEECSHQLVLEADRIREYMEKQQQKQLKKADLIIPPRVEIHPNESSDDLMNKYNQYRIKEEQERDLDYGVDQHHYQLVTQDLEARGMLSESLSKVNPVKRALLSSFSASVSPVMYLQAPILPPIAPVVRILEFQASGEYKLDR